MEIFTGLVVGGMILISFNLYSKRVVSAAPTSAVSSVVPAVNAQKVPTKVEALTKKLDEQLLHAGSTGYNDAMDDLLLDLAVIDRNAARNYFKKIQEEHERKYAAMAAELVEKAPVTFSAVSKVIEQAVAAPITSTAQQTESSVQTAAPVAETVAAPTVPAAGASAQETGSAAASAPPAAVAQSKEAITKELDAQLLQPVDVEWNKKVDALIFDLSAVDRDAASEYLKKVYAMVSKVPTSSVAVPVAESPGTAVAAETASGVGTPTTVAAVAAEVPAPPVGGAMVKSTPPAPPGKKSTAPMAMGTPPPPPGGATMTQGTPPPSPGGGMKKTGGGPPPPPPGGLPKPGAKKALVVEKQPEAAKVPVGPAPLSFKESYGLPQLAKRSDDELVTLFNELLDALATVGDFWDAVKKEPLLPWTSRIDTVKKAMTDPKYNRNIAIDVDKKIKDRIVAVKAEKVAAGKKKQEEAVVQEEKPKEDLTEAELIALLTTLVKTPDSTNQNWEVKMKANIQKLSKLNYEEAVKFEQDYVNITKGKKFLKAPTAQKAKETPKELTAQEKLVASIEQILKDKDPMWQVKVRNPIQELYDMDSAAGLEYQAKCLAEVKKVTKKDEKPFLVLK